jgi:hypothetical protein
VIIMATNTNKRPVGKAIIWGIITVAAYLAVFLNVDTVMEYFTRGGVFAGVVLVTALFFSFLHGSFANYLIESLGLKPLTKGGH